MFGLGCMRTSRHPQYAPGRRGRQGQADDDPIGRLFCSPTRSRVNLKRLIMTGFTNRPPTSTSHFCKVTRMRPVGERQLPQDSPNVRVSPKVLAWFVPARSYGVERTRRVAAWTVGRSGGYGSVGSVSRDQAEAEVVFAWGEVDRDRQVELLDQEVAGEPLRGLEPERRTETRGPSEPPGSSTYGSTSRPARLAASSTSTPPAAPVWPGRPRSARPGRRGGGRPRPGRWPGGAA